MQQNLYPVRAIAPKHVAAAPPANRCVIRVAKEQKSTHSHTPGWESHVGKNVVNLNFPPGECQSANHNRNLQVVTSTYNQSEYIRFGRLQGLPLGTNIEFYSFRWWRDGSCQSLDLFNYHLCESYSVPHSHVIPDQDDLAARLQRTMRCVEDKMGASKTVR